MILPLYDISILFFGITIMLLVTSELVSSRYEKLVRIDRKYLRFMAIFSAVIFMILAAVLAYQRVLVI